ncbi:cytochrome c-type biogenesis protein [Albimonas pacifica]|uniref:Cytochrome c-type biogenesis protein n=1 Tax=Albimonas pacifica TaxID=1114924 RepID=A0A1I3HWL5_9RHOB|nr:cytochrome c-type biogenesis protein [Albimonas pacifica]SFI40013.1 cytochrome c-type biogenesis protein CcmH [Albimonas pacifica]
MRALRPLLLALALLAPLAAPAVQPDEVLADPALEARARALSAEIRCLVCRSESIDESNADLARDLRVLVRERLVAGDSDAEVKAYLVERYGEYVLLKPTFSAGNAVLWFGGPALLIGGGVLAFFWIRRARPEAAATAAPLSAEEKARLDALMKQDGA